MDVVELVPSVSFSPRTNLYGRMSDDVTFKVIAAVFIKVIETSGLFNREMTQNRVGSRAKWVAPMLGYIHH